jgi:uncharacterized protein YjbJ (UPF0337 family)
MQAIDIPMHSRWHTHCDLGGIAGPSVRTSPSGEAAMNWDRVEGNWKQFKGKVKEQWGRLTDDDLDVIDGKKDQLAGKIQESYGISKDEAEQQIDRWTTDYRDETSSTRM